MKVHVNRLPEANIQAEVYRYCKNNGIRCMLEYKYEHSMFDAVLYDDNMNVYAIIEVKSYLTDRMPNYNTKQIRKYKQYGIPVYIVGRMERVKNIVDNAVNGYGKNKDV